ncbi:Heme oxygenase [Enhygromyxa salina]|uniref:Heme oxygenase n=1 Tax=Enhygromyxa salina TaxID=215803 RepID=A0A2S9YAY4_9BACT|nr:biliverdin-producing heme oxygenase [Enhygromyxa salina]PRQ02274.1 Heme oxygenase [Enhygromyxa salina]
MTGAHVTAPSSARLTKLLRSVTHDHHRALQTLPAFELLLRPTLDVDTFGLIQTRFFGVFEPLEAAVLRTQLWPRLGLVPAPRAPQLASDLVALGYHPHSLPRQPIAGPPDLAASAGIAYVLEGSRLGARVVEASLSTHRWYQGLRQRFYDCDASVAKNRWQRFTTALEHNIEPVHHQNCADAAKHTFTTFHQWMSQVDADEAICDQ